ncbi:NADPH-dependent FMN reductase [Lutibaculum baratangense]|uniref:NADPH-dependent FMN reductase n=1 Tax=Lutibaculum baratangense AMV1 TaxID=631454 RepID=V4RDE4_9HYPH|nr:NADPH-dependent FMN reductase [Lutibaculum baratangense]ESR24181.1 NADPH-dependent FMN reductase [Lutibaculum baratangense AMV1]
MTTILGISGSLRKGSLNTALLRAAEQLMPEGSTLDAAGVEGVPLYNADDEAADGVPPAVEELKRRLRAADGLILVTPEYNNSIPGVFKNAIDWMSRPSSEIAQHFGGKPVALIGASPGGFGTILSQEAWLPVLRTLRTRPWFGGRLLVSRANTLTEDGEITDEATRQKLAEFLAGFVAFAKAG